MGWGPRANVNVQKLQRDNSRATFQDSHLQILKFSNGPGLPGWVGLALKLSLNRVEKIQVNTTVRESKTTDK